MKTILLTIFYFFLSIAIFAQNKTGLGNVSSTTGILIPNAIVKMAPVSDPTTISEYVCDKNGNYTFDITSTDNSFIINILPSIQTLQFTFTEDTITLINGSNGLSYFKVNTINSKGINFTINDTLGNPVSSAKVTLYDTKDKLRKDSCRIAKSYWTDANGQVNINSLLPAKYWFRVKKGLETNSFTIDSTSTAIDTTNTTNITVLIRPLKPAELKMCGPCDNKIWVTDSMILFGITMPYDADTKLLSDATWWDSNGRYGYWWFNDDETVMTYNYLDGTATGSIIDATNMTITDSTWVGDMDFNNMPVTYFMSVHELDSVNLSMSLNDTTIYIQNNGSTTLSGDDLFLNSGHCPTCDVQVTPNTFNNSDIGNDVQVMVSIIDGCGNTVSQTITVTVADPATVSIKTSEKSKISIFPNPAKDHINFESSDENIKMIEFYSINGALLTKIELNTKQYSYKLSDLSKGVYISKIHTAKGVITKKIIIN